MSGGVDSAVAAYLLKQEGYEVIGVTLRTWEASDGGDSRCCEIDDAKEACRKIGIEHHSFNCMSVFDEKVIRPFINDYLAGTTPNPCVVCNRFVKWERLLYHMQVLKADLVATGHYADIVRCDNGRFSVRTAKAARKDQSYMLWMLTQEQLSKTRMPLCDMAKEEVRSIAASIGLEVADKPDSQEICFVPDDDHARFIEEETGTGSEEGNFVDESGNVLGRHKGIIRYTVGQRKGLGIAFGVPMFVKRIDAKQNEVVLAEDAALYERVVICRDVNFMSIPCIEEGSSIECRAKIRYHHTAAPAEACMENGMLKIVFHEPVRAAAPGQSAVLYDSDGCVIGGGVII